MHSLRSVYVYHGVWLFFPNAHKHAESFSLFQFTLLLVPLVVLTLFQKHTSIAKVAAAVATEFISFDFGAINHSCDCVVTLFFYFIFRFRFLLLAFCCRYFGMVFFCCSEFMQNIFGFVRFGQHQPHSYHSIWYWKSLKNSIRFKWIRLDGNGFYSNFSMCIRFWVYIYRFISSWWCVSQYNMLSREIDEMRTKPS